jgi:protein-tyrosine phosphatase
MEFNRFVRKNDIDVDILLGAEVHISHDLVEKVRKNREMLVLNGSSYMFVEFPSDHVFQDIKNLFFELMSEKIIPIIAHPERNSVFSHNPSSLFDLIQMGALAQANSGSFRGVYGEHTKETVVKFLECRLIHFIASDGHNTKTVSPRLSEALKMAIQLVGEIRAKNLVIDNPQAVLDDRELPHLENPIDPKSVEKTFKIKIPRIFRKKKNPA